MKKLKKLSASVVVAFALTTPAFAGVIECPLTPAQTTPARIQCDPAVEAVSTGGGSTESEDNNSLTGPR